MNGRLQRRFRLALPLLAIAALALVLGAAEAWLAWRDPGLLWRDPASGDDGLQFYRFHPEVGLFHKADFSGEYRGVVYSMNGDGLRGPEIARARTQGRPRVVVLGDSLVWGFGVPDGDSLCAALTQRRPDWDVLNFGVAGFGTGQELMLLEAEALAWRPDRVVLVFTLANDVADSFFPDSADAYPANLFSLGSAEGGDLSLRVHRFELSRLDGLGLWLRHNSRVVAFAADAGFRGGAPVAGAARASEGGRRSSRVGESNRRRLEALEIDWSRFASLRYLEHPAARPELQARRGGLLAPTPEGHYQVELVKQLLLEIARVTRGAGAELLVVLAPFRAQLGGEPALRENPLTAELVRFLGREGVPKLDLLPELLASGLPADRIYLDPMHFSAEGNRLVAGLIARVLPR